MAFHDMKPLYLIDLWREACRHIELAESLPNFCRLLEPALGSVTLEVRVLDRASGIMDIVATSESSAIGLGRASLPVVCASALAAWCGSGEALRQDELVAKMPLLEPAFPRLQWSWIAGLPNQHELTGLLVLTSLERRQLEPSAIATLIEPIAAAFENHARLHELERLREAAEAERQRLRDRLGRSDDGEAVIGADAGLADVMTRVSQVARADLPVLLLGETGSGKEVVAREIHTHSDRSAGPFIRVNCGALPPELIDSELFGHERGSFTGATARRRGWFERADGGTLFLDEIGELPPAAQVRLLRVLQDGLINRMGAEHAITVNVRVIAATHRDLPQMVQAGEFRADLWYRIATFPIVLPPLRERPGDVAALARHFSERAARRFGLRSCALTAGDLELLATYQWPGNVRELAAVIDRATILGKGQDLAIEQALGFQSPRPSPAVHGALQPCEPASVEAVEVRSGRKLDSFDVAVRQHIERALALSRGRIEGPYGAATLLGLNPHTLRAKMRKLAIDWQRYREHA